MKVFFAEKASKSIIGLLVAALVVGGISAQASGVLNTPSGGYLLCVNSKTKVVTHPGTTNCPKGSKKITVGAAGKDGKTLWNGEKDPENTLGSPGDMFINSSTKTLFGPKNLDGIWPTGISMVGPKGDQGPIGTGARGAPGSNATLTCAQGGTCALGDTGPGGGIVFIVRTPTAAAPWRYMEAAPYTWSGGVADPEIVWCNNTSDFVPNLFTGDTTVKHTSIAIGAGYSNTQKMLRGCTHGAANAAVAYSGGGKSDWHLPSKDELYEMHVQRERISPINLDSPYTTSSEEIANAHWSVWTNAGEIQVANFSSKTAPNGFYVRPVRAF